MSDSYWSPRDSLLAVIDAIAVKHGMTAADIRGPDRRHKFVIARHEAMAAVKQAKPDMSYPQMGRLFNRDHSTVLYAVKKHNRGEVK